MPMSMSRALDFGIVITVVDDANGTLDSVDNVCEDGVVHEGGLLPGHSLMVGTWFSPDALFSAKCHMWVTEDGRLPPASEPVSSHVERPSSSGQRLQLRPGQNLDVSVMPFLPYTVHRDGEKMDPSCVVAFAEAG